MAFQLDQEPTRFYREFLRFTYAGVWDEIKLAKSCGSASLDANPIFISIKTSGKTVSFPIATKRVMHNVTQGKEMPSEQKIPLIVRNLSTLVSSYALSGSNRVKNHLISPRNIFLSLICLLFQKNRIHLKIWSEQKYSTPTNKRHQKTHKTVL